MNGKNCIIIGESGAGKTTLLKQLTTSTGKEKIIFSIDTEFTGAAFFNNWAAYLKAAGMQRDSILIIDEANAVLKHDKEDKELIKIMMRARKYNNLIFVSFHAFRQVPLWLLMYSNYCIRFNTADQTEIQAKRFISYPFICKALESRPKLKPHKYEFLPVTA